MSMSTKTFFNKIIFLYYFTLHVSPVLVQCATGTVLVTNRLIISSVYIFIDKLIITDDSRNFNRSYSDPYLIILKPIP